MSYVTLYHGGSRVNVDSLHTGLDPKRSFYCSRDRSVASSAAFSNSFEGCVREIEIPSALFLLGISKGVFEERPYFGYLSEGSTEVVIHRGKGVDLLNFILFHTKHISDSDLEQRAKMLLEEKP